MNNSHFNLFKDQLHKAKECAEKTENKPKLLLHACCAPCSSHVLTVLDEYFDISVYFYNPNIDDREEYVKRLHELERFTDNAGYKEVDVIDGDYEPELFFEMAKGREELPERGARCYDCYMLRMRKSADYAREQGYDYFTTTLSISPYKNAKWLNEIGMILEAEMKENYASYPEFLFSDFKKENGYAHSIELSKEYGLYRQDYCGCKFSKAERERKIKEKEN